MSLPPLSPKDRKHVAWMARTYSAAQLAEAIVRDPLCSRVYLIVNQVRDESIRRRMPKIKTRIKSIRAQLQRRSLSQKRFRALIREKLTLEIEVSMHEASQKRTEQS